MLVERSGKLVTREEIQTMLWQNQTFVDFEQGLNYCVRQIRIALEDNADQPIFIATIPRRGYRFVAEVSTVPSVAPPQVFHPDRIPETTTTESPPSVSPEPTPTTPRVSISPSTWPRRARAFIVTTAVVLFGIFLSWTIWRKHVAQKLSAASDVPAAQQSAPIQPRPSVAVLGFANLAGQQNKAWLSTALIEMLSTELAEGGKLRIVSGDEVVKARRTIIQQEDLPEQALPHLRSQLGADMIVQGSYTVIDQGHERKLRLDVRLQNTRDGQILDSFAQVGNESELFDLISATGTRLRQSLGLNALSAGEQRWIDRSLPSDQETRRLYAEGLTKQRLSDALGARDMLQKVVVREPQFAPAHAALAESWAVLGYEAKATAEALKAKEQSSGMPREEQLSVEARYYETAKDRPHAIEVLKALLSFFPDNIDYGIRLATVQMEAGQIKESLATVATLRKLPDPLGTSARLDLLQAQILNYSGDFKQGRDFADQAIRKGRALGAQHLVADALNVKTSLLERLGQLDESLAAATEMKQIETETGFTRGIGLALLGSGDAFAAKTDYDRAKQDYSSALAIFRELGTKKDQGLALERIGNVFLYTGHFAQSRDAYKQAREAYQEVQWPMGVAAATANLANALYSLGDLKGALQMHQETLQTFEQMGYQRAVPAEIDNIAVMQGEMGDLSAAAENHRKSLDLQKKAGYPRGEMFSLGGLGDILLMQGDVPAAKLQYEQARNLAQSMKEDGDIAQYDLSLARILFYEQRFPEAEALVHRSITQFEKTKTDENRAPAYGLLAQILLEEHRQNDAIDAGRKAETLSKPTDMPSIQLEVSLTLGRLEASLGKKEAAKKRLQTVLLRAQRGGYTEYILKTRKELIGLEAESSQRNLRSALAAEARQKGFGLISLELARTPARKS